MNNNKIEIEKSEYISLLVAQERLSRLEIGGVDNWDWYGESLNPEDEPDMDEFKENLEKEYGIKK